MKAVLQQWQKEHPAETAVGVIRLIRQAFPHAPSQKQRALCAMLSRMLPEAGLRAKNNKEVWAEMTAEERAAFSEKIKARWEAMADEERAALSEKMKAGWAEMTAEERAAYAEKMSDLFWAQDPETQRRMIAAMYAREKRKKRQKPTEGS